MRDTLRPFLALSLLALCCTASAQSDAAASTGGDHKGTGGQACKADAESFCKGVQPGGGRIARCLAEHKNELTEPCKTALTAAAKNRRHKDKDQ
jgi:hypothetical protein